MPRNIIAAVAVLCVAEGVLMTATPKADDISARARKLHFASLVVDTHDDTTQRFLDGGFDLGARSDAGSIDIPRMKEGGLGAIFFSIWIPSKITGPEAIKHALDQIDAVSKAPLIASHSSCRAICDARRNMTDQMIKDLAAKGGVIQINYHVGFLSEEFMNADKNPEITKAIAAEVEKRCGDKEGCQLIEGDRITREYVHEGKLPRVDY